MPDKSLNILLIEDNDPEVYQIKEAIKNHNRDHQISVLSDGFGVVEYLEAQSKMQSNSFPDLILLDLNLPKHSGRKVIQDVKNHPNLKTIPIVVLTSSEVEDDIQKSYQGKISSYIVKPVDNDDFERAIISALDFYSLTQMPTNNQIK